MTNRQRDEQIRDVAKQFLETPTLTGSRLDLAQYEVFIRGAQWADQNPIPSEPDWARKFTDTEVMLATRTIEADKWRSMAEELAEVLRQETNFFVNCYKTRHSEKVQKVLAEFNEMKK